MGQTNREETYSLPWILVIIQTNRMICVHDLGVKSTIVPKAACHFTWSNMKISLTYWPYGINKTEFGWPRCAILSMWFVPENKSKTCFMEMPKNLYIRSSEVMDSMYTFHGCFIQNITSQHVKWIQEKFTLKKIYFNIR